jgi:DNA primase
MESDVEKIKERLPINEVVGGYVQLKRAGKNYSAKCPFHKERTPSFQVSPERGTYMCFGCGERGDIFSFVQKIESVDFPTALRQLAERAGVTLTRNAAPAPGRKEKDERLRELTEAAIVFFEAALKERKDVLHYLTTRGLKAETIAQWRLGYAPAAWEALCTHLAGNGYSKDEIVEAGFAVKSEKKQDEVFDRFRGRIIFPIFDAGGKPIAVSGRFFEKVPGQKSDTEPAKYVNSPETALFKKSRTLYGLDRAKGAIRKADCILLVEGQFDLILSHQSNLPFAVALSGTALTPEHLGLLARFSKRLVLALDADAAGLRAGFKSTYLALAAGFDVKIPALPQGKDPADLARENPELLKAAVRTSQTAVEFFLNALWPTARDERSYKKLVEAQVLPLVAVIGSRIEQAHFVQLLAARLAVPEGAVAEEVDKLRRAPRGAVAAEPVPVGSGAGELPFLERTAGMLLYYFERDPAVRTRLEELLGAERVGELSVRLLPHAEDLRFRFEEQLIGQAEPGAIAGDLLRRIELASIDEEIVKARGDARKILELARRKHNLQK